MKNIVVLLGVFLMLIGCSNISAKEWYSDLRDGNEYRPNGYTQEKQINSSATVEGKVVEIEKVEPKQTGRRVVGGVIGGGLGYLVGKNVGGGSGNDIARVAGTALGAYGGSKFAEKKAFYKIYVRLNNGKLVFIERESDSGFYVGQKLQLEL